MDELIRLCHELLHNLNAQIAIVEEFEKILEREEHYISKFDLVEFEQALVEKDQCVQRLHIQNKKRESLLRKICYLISYDAREKLPSLTDFLKAFSTYLVNIRKLVSEDIHLQVAELYNQLQFVGDHFKSRFDALSPKLYKNQQILKKLSQNFQRSLQIFEGAMMRNQNYDGKGMAHQNPVQEQRSSLHVKV